MEGSHDFKSELFFKKRQLEIKYGEDYKVRYFKILNRALNIYSGYNINNVKVVMEELYKEGIISENEYKMYESDCDITKALYNKLNSGLVEKLLTQSKN